jgi:hypothetical protein
MAAGTSGSLWDALGLVPLRCKPLNFDRERGLTALVMPLLTPLATLHDVTRDAHVLLEVVSQLVRVSAATMVVSQCPCA